MKYEFSERVKGLKPSAIREILKNSSAPGVIPLSAGNPAPDAFPYEDIRRISAELLESTPIEALQYSVTEGYLPLREHLLSYMREKHGAGGENDEILITSGAQQVMDLLTKTLLNEGDTVLCEAPSFIGSLNTFRSYRAKLRGIPMEEDGLSLEQLENALRQEKKIKYLYTIPNFQNPSGITMSLAKRKRVYELCRDHNVLILEDNPYGDLRFAGEELPPIKSFDREGVVLYAGSFSKVVSPGMRVGYAIGPREIVQKMVVCKQGEDVHSNIWAQIVCHRFMTECDYEAHLCRLREIYRRKSQVLRNAMEQYFRPLITWSEFQGGLFAWCTLPERVDMLDFVKRAAEEKVCVVPGTAFLTDETEPCRSFRVNFSTPTDEQLTEGIKLLGSLAGKMAE
ncbi:PLP-dependent aminotransferase family protein [Neglectibacter caecimuris]|uniref:aminotransferase-like domain-containing protein n=1 Tax=Neglectibacter caecimuris TaxID=3093658 RepID=UPI002AC9D48D|nr:PLP-dependent aminotransferase family protein [Neglectibacter sp. M00184]